MSRFLDPLMKFARTKLFVKKLSLKKSKNDSDVGSSYPGAEAGPKGLAVRQLKRYASWVKTVARQVGLNLP